jgi:transcriptional regulator with PAS, ATPase and Fis domain
MTAKYSFDHIISRDRTIAKLKEHVMTIAQTKSTVLITGESGTGKELFSQAIHNLSPRRGKPFISINCAAIPENLLESELFGYEKGAFTGALKEGKPGEFEMANEGTLMLDEIDSLPLRLQAKILRVIQEKEVKRIGRSYATHVDVRLIFTTNKDLNELIRKGEFREDLYYRINVVNLSIPPLRDRIVDLPHLVDHFINKFNIEMGMHVTGVSEEALGILSEYTWPGNIRELQNSIERAFNYTTSGVLEREHFDYICTRLKIRSMMCDKKQTGAASLKSTKEVAEKDAIILALKATGGNKKRAAEKLGINRSVLYEKLKKYEIE